jgi:hypothetical protein
VVPPAGIISCVYTEVIIREKDHHSVSWCQLGQDMETYLSTIRYPRVASYSPGAQRLIRCEEVETWLLPPARPSHRKGGPVY